MLFENPTLSLCRMPIIHGQCCVYTTCLDLKCRRIVEISDQKLTAYLDRYQSTVKNIVGLKTINFVAVQNITLGKTYKIKTVLCNI